MMYFSEDEVRHLVLGEVAVAQRWTDRRWELFNEIVLGNPQMDSTEKLAKVARALHTFPEDQLSKVRYFDVMEVAEA